MATKTDHKTHRMVVVPVTTMVGIPVLTPQERNDLILSLEEAEGRVDAGQFEDYDPTAFEERLLDINRNARRA